MSRIEDKAQTMTDTLQVQAQSKFIKWVMKEEDCSYEEAWAICNGQTDPKEYEYMLGFKMANPILQIALFKQISKKARRQAAANFAATLCDEEKEMFYGQIFNEETAAKFKTQYKAAKKNKGDLGEI